MIVTPLAGFTATGIPANGWSLNGSTIHIADSDATEPALFGPTSTVSITAVSLQAFTGILPNTGVNNTLAVAAIDAEWGTMEVAPSAATVVALLPVGGATAWSDAALGTDTNFGMTGAGGTEWQAGDRVWTQVELVRANADHTFAGTGIVSFALTPPPGAVVSASINAAGNLVITVIFTVQ